MNKDLREKMADHVARNCFDEGGFIDINEDDYLYFIKLCATVAKEAVERSMRLSDTTYRRGYHDTILAIDSALIGDKDE